MNHFIAVSFASSYDSHRQDDICRQAAEALSRFSGEPVEVIEQNAGMLVLSTASLDRASVKRSSRVFMLSMCAAFTNIKSHRRLSQTELADAWFSDDNAVLAGLGAPFVLCGKQHPEGAFRALTDRYGLGQIFGWQGAGICAIASSALIVGRTFALGMNLDAVGEFAHLGHYLGADTAVKGVQKCTSGHSLAADQGRLETRTEFSASPQEADKSAAFCSDKGADALRESVQAYVDAYPECDIELSGGIDSRLMLAAIPISKRRNHTAVTIGSTDSPDVKIARQIAELSGMRHRVVDINAKLINLSSAELLKALRSASLKHDYAVNPIDKVAIEISRSELGVTPRLSGQNGEILRGFYYPGQPLHGGYTQSRLERLVQWRLSGNDAVQQALLRPGFQRRAKTSLTRSARQLLQPADSWTTALDRFYLDQRMQRWCGSAVSAAYAQRPVLMPFFHPAFVDWSLSLPAADKRGSRTACALISTLAPELSSLPFDSGPTPLQLARTGLDSKAYNALVLGRKSMQRILQKLSGLRRHNLGTHSVTSLLEKFGAIKTLDIDALHSTGIFEATVLEKIARGESGTDRATLGFLFAINDTVAFLEGHKNQEPAEVIWPRAS